MCVGHGEVLQRYGRKGERVSNTSGRKRECPGVDDLGAVCVDDFDATAAGEEGCGAVAGGDSVEVAGWGESGGHWEGGMDRAEQVQEMFVGEVK